MADVDAGIRPPDEPSAASFGDASAAALARHARAESGSIISRFRMVAVCLLRVGVALGTMDHTKIPKLPNPEPILFYVIGGRRNHRETRTIPQGLQKTYEEPHDSLGPELLEYLKGEYLEWENNA